MKRSKCLKKESSNLLQQLEKLDVEIYGLDIISDEGLMTDNQQSFLINKDVETPYYYRSKENYQKIREFIFNTPSDSSFLFFYDYPNDDIKYLVSGVAKCYDHQNSIKMLDYIRSKKFKLLGIDGLYITAEYTQPSTEYIVDFSSSEKQTIDYASEDIYVQARLLLEKMPLEMYAEFVYEDLDIR